MMKFNFFIIFLESEPSITPKVTLFQIEYYQQFFNIDTVEVVERIVNSFVPKRVSSSYLKNNLGKKKKKFIF